MIEIKEKQKCSGCGACSQRCPQACIAMRPDGEGFLYPAVDEARCVRCGGCVRVCPMLTPQEREPNRNCRAYAAVHREETVRRNSSSGGVFFALASAVIRQNGVVFGAAMSDDCKTVLHAEAHRTEELGRLMGSKYVQSRIGNAYASAERYLQAGRRVLFSGTPCQIAGLRAFLQRDYDHLLTQDLICHGVPSPSVWEGYVDSFEQKRKSPVRRASFREKTSGWETYSLVLDFADQSRYCRSASQDLYLRGFLSDLYLRPSCYACPFKGTNRRSDLTLADLWGAKDIAPSLYDGKGTSLVLANTEKGEKALCALPQLHPLLPVEAERAFAYNRSALVCAKENGDRGAFFRALQKNGVKRALKRYCSPKPSERLKRAVKSVLRRRRG